MLNSKIKFKSIHLKVTRVIIHQAEASVVAREASEAQAEAEEEAAVVAAVDSVGQAAPAAADQAPKTNPAATRPTTTSKKKI